MKSLVSLLFLISGAALQASPAVAVAPGSSHPKRACCQADVADEPPASAATTALTAKSLYQLDTTWTDDSGTAVSLASWRGQPVVLAMFFANCEYACPVLVSDLQRLQQSLPPAVRDRARFILVSFDPARDTPTALKAYRARAKLDSAWTLLRGDEQSVRELAMLLGVKYQQDARGQFSHSNLMTVLNREGEIAYQRAGLMGDVSETAKAVVVAAR